MGSWVNLVIFIGVLIAALSFLYQTLPSKPLPVNRPSFALLPKYHFSYQDNDELKNNLLAEGFTAAGPNRFVRGSYFGDFLAKWIKLTVTTDEDARVANLGSPMVVIAFDTGDLWDIATRLRKSA